MSLRNAAGGQFALSLGGRLSDQGPYADTAKVPTPARAVFAGESLCSIEARSGVRYPDDARALCTKEVS